MSMCPIGQLKASGTLLTSAGGEGGDDTAMKCWDCVNGRDGGRRVGGDDLGTGGPGGDGGGVGGSPDGPAAEEAESPALADADASAPAATEGAALGEPNASRTGGTACGRYGWFRPVGDDMIKHLPE